MDNAKPTKAELEREARLLARAAAANVPPPSTDLSHLDALPTVTLTEPEPTAAPAPAPAKAAAKKKPAAKPKKRPAKKAQPAAPVHMHRRADDPVPPPPPPAPAAEPAPAPTPWCDAHPKHRPPFLVRLPEDIHMKLAWLKENLPNTSMQKLVLQAIEEKINALVEKHYKPAADKAA